MGEHGSCLEWTALPGPSKIRWLVAHAYPIFLDVSDRLIVIVGGGAVAARKAQGLLSAGATRVRAIAPKFARDFPAAIERAEQTFTPALLEGAGLVFAATDSPTVNASVVAAARERKIWVNRADVDDDEPADFTTPALLRCGAITVAVSASGAPALAAVVRDELVNCVTDDWANLADMTRRIRPAVRLLNLPMGRRREIFRMMATPAAAAALSAGGKAGLWQWIVEKFPELRPILFNHGEHGVHGEIVK